MYPVAPTLDKHQNEGMSTKSTLLGSLAVSSTKPDQIDPSELGISAHKVAGKSLMQHAQLSRIKQSNKDVVSAINQSEECSQP